MVTNCILTLIFMVKIAFAINILLIVIKHIVNNINHSDNVNNIDNIEQYDVIFKISVVQQQQP